MFVFGDTDVICAISFGWNQIFRCVLCFFWKVHEILVFPLLFVLKERFVLFLSCLPKLPMFLSVLVIHWYPPTGGGGHLETSAADPKHSGGRRSPHQYRHWRLCQGLGKDEDGWWMSRVGFLKCKKKTACKICNMKSQNKLTRFFFQGQWVRGFKRYHMVPGSNFWHFFGLHPLLSTPGQRGSPMHLLASRHFFEKKKKQKMPMAPKLNDDFWPKMTKCKVPKVMDFFE